MDISCIESSGPVILYASKIIRMIIRIIASEARRVAKPSSWSASEAFSACIVGNCRQRINSLKMLVETSDEN